MNYFLWGMLLAAVEYYFYSNLAAFGVEHRNVNYLVLIVFLSIAISLPSFLSIRTTTVRYSFFFVSLFVSYYAFRVAYDIQENELWPRLFGSDAGIIYYYVFGVILSLPFQRIILVGLVGGRRSSILGWLGVAFAMLSSLSPVVLMVEALSRTRADIFLVQEGDELYQWPGDLMSIRFIMVSVIFGVWFVISREDRSAWFRFMRAMVISLLIFQVCAALVYLQIIGSNKAAVFIIGCLLVIVCIISLQGRGGSIINIISGSGYSRVSISFSNVLKSLWRPALISGVCLFLIGILVYFYGFGYDKLRLLGFGSGEISSIDSRLLYIENNFIKQFSIAPFFGNAEADVVAGGVKGEYVHSVLLYLLSHSGLFGCFLFVLAVVVALIEAKRVCSVRSALSWCEFEARSLIRVLFTVLFGIPLLLGALGTSVIWAPLWFAFGFLMSPFSIGMMQSCVINGVSCFRVVRC